MITECEGYALVLSELRTQIIAILRELPADLLNSRPINLDSHEANSLAVLASHVAGAEYHWICEVVGQDEWTRNRPDEFATEAKDARGLIAKIEQTAAASEWVLGSLTARDLLGERVLDGRTFAVRWCILHAIEHMALHLGHMQLSRQLLVAQDR